MARRPVRDLQAHRDICRAEFLVAVNGGLTRDEGANALRFRAAARGLTLHATALAVLSEQPADEVLFAQRLQPTEVPELRHLQALRAVPDDGTTPTSSATATAETDRPRG